MFECWLSLQFFVEIVKRLLETTYIKQSPASSIKDKVKIRFKLNGAVEVR